MKILTFLFIALILFFVAPVFSQQLNYSYGQKTDGTWYTETGYISADSLEQFSIVYDMQDYYFVDYNPLFSDDSVIIGNSNRLYVGTFWYMVDAAQAADSTNIYIKAYPGGRYYEAGNETRVETADLFWSTTAITLVDSIGANANKGDIGWTPVNVYFHATVKVLPPEFFKLDIGFDIQSFDGGSSGSVYWYFAYYAVYENVQEDRTTRASDSDRRKPDESLH